MRRDIDSRSLEVFLAVCDTGSMTGAARLLGVTQGAVSQQIGRLETLLDLRLLSREGRELKLLPAGLHLRHHARRVVEELRECERSMQRFRGFSFPRVSIGVLDTLSQVLTSTVIDSLHGLVEQIQVRSSVSYNHPDELLAETIDMFVSAQEFEADLFEIHPIVSEPMVLVVPRGVVSPDRIDLEKLGASLPLVRFAHRRRFGQMIDHYLARQGLVVERSIEMDQAAPVMDTVRRGQGWVITTPFSLLDPSLEVSELDVLPLPGPTPYRDIKLVSLPSRFADLPSRIAQNCRTYLSAQIAGRLSLIAPRVTGLIVVAG